MKCSRFSQRSQPTVASFTQVRRKVIALGMQQAAINRRLACGPEVTFEPIAGRAAVNQILPLVSAAGRAWPKVINFQFTADLFLSHATVTATVVVGTTNNLSDLLRAHCAPSLSGITQRLAESALKLTLQGGLFIEQAGQLSFGSRQQISLTLCDSGKHSILRSCAARLLLKLHLLLAQAFQCRVQRAPFFLFQFVKQLFERLPLFIGQCGFLLPTA
jgi:hypothetical protein